MRIVVFGVGKYYKKRKKNIPGNIEIVAFIDNNSKIWGNTIDGIKVYRPNQIFQFQYDRILLMSLKMEEMRRQLLDMGVSSEEIWYWEYFISEINRGIFRFYFEQENLEKSKKKVLVISTDLHYNGGTIAVMYAVKALQNREYSVILAAPAANQNIIDEAMRENIKIAIIPALSYLHKEILQWIQQFDIVFVNVFQMILCACEISKIKPVLWWIHEPKELYRRTIEQFREFANMNSFKKINIYAVSDIAKNNFNFYFPERIRNLLPYGIPDNAELIKYESEKKELVFAIIGMVTYIKAQDIFIEAIRLLSPQIKKKAHFWIIGAIGNDNYSDKIKNFVLEDSSIKLWGELSRSRIHEMYKEIDVLVCPSREDSLPIVVTEGMMYGKICIVSDKIGTTKYIVNGENGFICKTENPLEFSKKMEWIIRNYEKLTSICVGARRTYEKYFSMESFGIKLEEALKNTIEKKIYIEGEL